MKTINMDYDEYLADLEQAKEEGRVSASKIRNLGPRLLGVLKVFNASVIGSTQYNAALDELAKLAKEAE